MDGGINLYAYVEGNPVNWIDPEGLITWTGTLRQGSVAYGVGTIVMYGTFESECKEGKKAIVEVLIVGPMLGVGGGYKNTAITGGTSSWLDYNRYNTTISVERNQQ